MNDGFRGIKPLKETNKNFCFVIKSRTGQIQLVFTTELITINIQGLFETILIADIMNL